MSAVGEISTADVVAALAGPWRNAVPVPLDSPLGVMRVSRGPYADSTTVFVVHDAQAQPHAVLLCSARMAPDLVARTMTRTTLADAALGGGFGARVLLPIQQGRIDGLSYALVPFCRPLSTSRPLLWWQNHQLQPVVFDWLAEVCRRTMRQPDDAALASRFEAPLSQLAGLPEASARLRDVAAVALQRMQAGSWQPRQVLMHGDLWRGNLMVRRAEGPWARACWVDRVAVIDWAGSCETGYPLFDLIKIAGSLAAGAGRLQYELDRHRKMLACDVDDVGAYLAAALAGTLATLENFPLTDFLSMSEMCLDTLMPALPHGVLS